MPKSTGRKRRQREAEGQAHAQHAKEETHGPQNVGKIERLFSSMLGGLMLIGGVNRRSVPGLGLAVTGAALLYRGATGHCPVYESLGLDTHHAIRNPARAVARAPEATRLETSTDAQGSSLETDGEHPIKTRARGRGIGKAALV